MKLRLFLLLSSLYLVLASREQPWGDAHVMYETSQSLVDRFRLDVSLGGPPQFYALRDGKKYGVFPLGNVVAMVPSYLAFRVLRLIPHQPAVEEPLFRFTSHLSPSLMIAGVCVLLFVLARREGASERAAFWLALLAGTGTILVVYARAPFSEALQTLALTWVLERGLSLGDRLSLRGGALAGVACGLLVNTKLVYAVVLPVPAIYVVVRHRKELARAAACLVAAAVPLALLIGGALVHNRLKTGALWDSGYRIPEGVFSGDAYAAVYGFFLSTGKSIFLYSPPLVLGFAALPSYLRTRRPHALFLVALSAAVVLVNAKFRYWHADYCWGPRLLVPLVPAMLLPAAPGIEEALARGRANVRACLVGALVGAGLYVQLLGCVFYWDHYIRIAIAVKDQTGAAGWYGEDLHHCHFIPQFSPLVGHAWMLRHKLRDDPDLGDAPWRRVAPGKVNLAGEWAATRFDWWVLDWKEIPSARAGMAALLLVLVGVGAASGVGIARRLDAPQRRRRPYVSGRG